MFDGISSRLSRTTVTDQFWSGINKQSGYRSSSLASHPPWQDLRTWSWLQRYLPSARALDSCSPCTQSFPQKSLEPHRSAGAKDSREDSMLIDPALNFVAQIRIYVICTLTLLWKKTKMSHMKTKNRNGPLCFAFSVNEILNLQLNLLLEQRKMHNIFHLQYILNKDRKIM